MIWRVEKYFCIVTLFGVVQLVVITNLIGAIYI